jgi:plastocyanin
MEERERQARMLPDGPGSALRRWLALAGAPAAVVGVLVMAAPAGAADATVEVNDFAFTPGNAPINQGDTVTWTNVEGNHNVVFDNGMFPPFPGPNGGQAPWMSPPRPFPGLGTFRYYCSEHGGPGGVGMAGTVTVSPPTPPGGPPPGPPNPPGGNPPGGGGGSGGGGGGSGGGGSQPGGPSTGSPGAGKSSTKVTLKVSDATPDSGDRVRFSGTVRPAQDGRLVQLQRRVGRSYRTVAKIKLTDAGSSRSKFSKRVRVLKDSVFRARLSSDSAHAAGTSGTKRVNVR